MNEFVFVSTKDQQRNHYLYGYYHRPILWFQRRFGGPILLLLGVLGFFLPRRFDYFSVFMVFFGLYYLLRPFIAIKRIKFKESSLKAAFLDSSIELSDDSIHWKIKKEEALKTMRKKNVVYFKFKQSFSQWIIFNLDFLETEKEEFAKRMEEFVKD
jgi:hypothetical protein